MVNNCVDTMSDNEPSFSDMRTHRRSETLRFAFRLDSGLLSRMKRAARAENRVLSDWVRLTLASASTIILNNGGRNALRARERGVERERGRKTAA